MGYRSVIKGTSGTGTVRRQDDYFRHIGHLQMGRITGSIVVFGVLAWFVALPGEVFPQYWERTYGGFGSDQGVDAVQMPDGSFFVLGSTGSFGAGGGDMYLLHLDANGQVVWSGTYGEGGVEYGNGIAFGANGVLLVGTTNSSGFGGYDILATKVDMNGVVEWQETFGTPSWDLAMDVASHPNGWVIVGKTYETGNGDGDAWVLCIDPSGGLLWSRVIDSGNGEDIARGVACDDLGRIIVVGEVSTPDDTKNAFVWRADADGNEDMYLEIGGGGDDVASSLCVTADGGYLVVGWTTSYSAFREILVCKVLDPGVLDWTDHYGQINDFEGRSVVEDDTGGIVVFGMTRAFGFGGSDAYLMFLSDTGAFVSGLTFGLGQDEVGISVIEAMPDGYLLVGTTLSYGPGPEAMHVIRVNDLGSTLGSPVDVFFDPLYVNEPSSKDVLLGIHPNPTTSGSSIQLGGTAEFRWQRVVLNDLLGRWCGEIPIDPSGRGTLPDLAPGTYLLQVHAADGRIGQVRCVVE